MKKNFKNLSESAKYKSDEDIAKEFDDFSIENLDLEIGGLDLYIPNTYKGYIDWEFPDGDEHVGGGSDTTVENFIYNTDTKTFKYVVDNWYPKRTYNKMVSIIKEKLEENYNTPFRYVSNIDFINLHEKEVRNESVKENYNNKNFQGRNMKKNFKNINNFDTFKSILEDSTTEESDNKFVVDIAIGKKFKDYNDAINFLLKAMDKDEELESKIRTELSASDDVVIGDETIPAIDLFDFLPSRDRDSIA